MKKTNNYKEFSEGYVRSQLSNKGEHSFKIKGTYLDELAHNTKDHNGSELGVIICLNFLLFNYIFNPYFFISRRI